MLELNKVHDVLARFLFIKYHSVNVTDVTYLLDFLFKRFEFLAIFAQAW